MSIFAVRAWIHQRKLLYMRFGRNIVVPLSDLERFIGTSIDMDSQTAA